MAVRQIFEEIREVKQDNGNFFDKILIFFDVAKSNFIGIGFALILILLEHAGGRKIVRSNHFGGLLQHDAFSWEVGALGFPYLKELDKSSLLMEGIIKEWINKLDMKQREYFVDILFGILADMGIERITDLPKVSNEKIVTFIKSMGSLPVETKEIFAKAIKLFFAETRIAIRKEIKDNFRPLGYEHEKKSQFEKRN